MITIGEKQIAPCICAKARFALGITKIRPTNSKTCSEAYWNRLIDYFGTLHKLSAAKIAEAKKMSFLYQR